MNIPADRQYAVDHTWVRADGDTVTIGITDHAQDELGEIVYLELPEPGRRVEQGANMGEIESVKTVSPLVSPVSGEVLTQNTAAMDKPELVNTDPYGEGWLVTVRVAGTGALNSLLSPEEYRALTESQA